MHYFLQLFPTISSYFLNLQNSLGLTSQHWSQSTPLITCRVTLWQPSHIQGESGESRPGVYLAKLKLSQTPSRGTSVTECSLPVWNYSVLHIFKMYAIQIYRDLKALNGSRYKPLCACACRVSDWAYLSTGQMQPECVHDLLQVSLHQVATVALVKVHKGHQQLLVVGQHQLLLLVLQGRRQTTLNINMYECFSLKDSQWVLKEPKGHLGSNPEPFSWMFNPHQSSLPSKEMHFFVIVV